MLLIAIRDVLNVPGFYLQEVRKTDQKLWELQMVTPLKSIEAEP